MKKRRGLIYRFRAYRRSVREVRLSRSRAGTFGIFVFLLILSALMVIPFYLAVVNSLKPIEEFFYWPPRLYVINPTLRNYRILFMLVDNWMVPFSRFVFNSVFAAVVGTTLAILISCLAAYPLAKAKIPGMKLITAVVIGALLFHNQSTDFMRFIIMSWFGMIDTYWAMLIPGLSGTMFVFLIRQFIVGTIQDEIIEAARIDGASEFRILFRVVMPIIRPAVLTMVVLAFPGFWAGTGAVGIYTEALRTLPGVLSQIALGGLALSGPAAAVAVIIMIPSFVVFVYSQRAMLQTMAYSGIK